MTGTELLLIERPAWERQAGDRWTEMADMEQAATALGSAPRRVLLTIGRKDLAPFAAAPWHDYVIRSVDAPPPESLPPRAKIITARGPFTLEDDRRMLQRGAHRRDRHEKFRRHGHAIQADRRAGTGCP